jgi:hypothetical protein
LRISLRDWMEANLPRDEMLWRGSAVDQMVFVRETLNQLVWTGVPWADRGEPMVISTHRSKSIDLPVYELSRPDVGIRLVMRDNFYNWKLSVLSERPLDVDLSGLCKTTPPVDRNYTGDALSEVYFEGFPSNLVFGYLDASDRRRFSAELFGREGVWTAVFLIMRSAGAIKPQRWHTRETHRTELDAEREADRRKREREECK